LAGRAARGESIPGEDRQLPYVHHAIDTDAEGADRVTFTWCSWSPGVVRDTATGAVVDDTVGHGTGTGVAERIAGTWMLSSLDESTLDLLPAGTADPCPGADRSRPRSPVAVAGPLPSRSPSPSWRRCWPSVARRGRGRP